MKTKQLLLWGAILCLAPIGWAQAQINLNKVKDKVSGNKQQEVKQTQAVQNTQQTQAADQQAGGKKAALEALLAQLKNNQVQVLSKTGKDAPRVEESFQAHLTFSNDFTNPSKDVTVFTGKDFVYARFQLPKNLLDYLPKPDDSNLEYYRLKVIAKANGMEEENNHRIEMKHYAKDALNTNELVVAVVPEKLFFESFTLAYQEGGKFPSATKEREAYQNVLARNTSRQVAELLKSLPEGEHIIEINFEITAKQKGSDYIQMIGAKGYFLITLDAESKERYEQVYDMLTDLYQEYRNKESIAGQQVSEEKEAEMLKSMSPRDQERYHIAKRSTDGYMAAYQGPKAACTFVLDNVRDKTAHIEILWEDGGPGKEAGRHGFFVSVNEKRETKNIPIGAKVSINGRVLIPKVSGNQTVMIYWYY
ncbi:hypothetical protein [Eisenibacter elegans]|uniref:hypothetical protein n=1 Tax=Eisenibacter elegans TaxID=997 RepID=UPI00042363FB|nr:hypothetical protein [Eisenibacter elegans]